jgi:GTP-binding protein HflX
MVIYTNEIPKEKAILVGVQIKRDRNPLFTIEESLDELAALAEAAGAMVLTSFSQKRDRIDTAHYIGKGLAEEINNTVLELEAELVIIDGELSGSQLRNLERMLNVKVLDRTTLILDIFAQRAKSREGKLQVELAQLKYSLPRLIGSNTELSRLAGGIGTRGPGETKLEKDKRVIREKINNLKQELVEIEKQRDVIKAGRKNNIPVLALVGYTNAGKSTLRYKLLQEFSHSEVDLKNEDPGTNQLFATLDPTVRGIALPNGQKVLLADTVGFVQRLPHHLVSAFKSTLSEVVDADILLHVIDVSNPHFEQQKKAVDAVLTEIGAQDKKSIEIYNKVDLLEDHVILVDKKNTVEISAISGLGFSKLFDLICGILNEEKQEVYLAFSHDESKFINDLYRQAKVISIDYQADTVEVKVLLDKSLRQKYESYVIKK